MLALALVGVVAVSGTLGTHPSPAARAASSSHGRGIPCPTTSDVVRPGRPRFVMHVSRIVVVLMENKECGEIVGNAAAPYENALAHRYAIAVNSHAIRHPSEPNYLALTGGSTFGDTSDCSDCKVRARNLVDELTQAGISWKAYIGDLPAPCSTVPWVGARHFTYLKAVDPFLFYVDIARDPSRCSHVVPLSELRGDLARHTLPRFVWISPDLCESGHSCSIHTADTFLSRFIPPLLRRLAPNGLLFLTWDEGLTYRGCCGVASGGQVAAIVAGGAARRGAVSTVRYDHYSVLRTIEGIWRLPYLRAAGCTCTRAMTDLIATIGDRRAVAQRRPASATSASVRRPRSVSR